MTKLRRRIRRRGAGSRLRCTPVGHCGGWWGVRLVPVRRCGLAREPRGYEGERGCVLRRRRRQILALAAMHCGRGAAPATSEARVPVSHPAALDRAGAPLHRGFVDVAFLGVHRASSSPGNGSSLGGGRSSLRLRGEFWDVFWPDQAAAGPHIFPSEVGFVSTKGVLCGEGRFFHCSELRQARRDRRRPG